MERKGPLKSIKVIEICNVIAGPFCAGLFADYGADVIKIEMPHLGDPVRGFGPKKGNEGLRWPSMGRNKKCITLDLRVPDGKKYFLELIKDADIVIENFKPGVIEKWGIGYDVMKEVNSKLVLVRISGYGQSGPYKNKPGFGTSGTAFSGYTALHGFEGLPPVSPAVSLADFMAGLFGFMGGLSAVNSILKGDTDRGQIVDVSLYESLVRLMDGMIADFSVTGKKQKINYMVKGVTSPCGTHKTKDNKWIIIVCSTQNTWEKLPIAMDMPELLEDLRFKTNQDRLVNDKELMEIIDTWAAKSELKDVWQLLDTAGVPASPVYEIDDMVNDIQYIARESIKTFIHPSIGEIAVPNIVPVFTETPGEIRYLGKSLGEDNELVYKKELKISHEEYDRLVENNVF